MDSLKELFHCIGISWFIGWYYAVKFPRVDASFFAIVGCLLIAFYSMKAVNFVRRRKA